MNNSNLSIKTEERHDTWAWIPPFTPKATSSQEEGDSSPFHATNGTSAVYDDDDDDGDNDFTCLRCIDERFDSEDIFLSHLRTHVELPDVVVHRLSPKYIKKLLARKPTRASDGVAKKSTKSYITPKSHGRLKLTLKLAADGSSKNRSFHVVPRNSVLAGPSGEVFSTNGVTFEQVKLEVVDREEQAAAGVEGEVEKATEEEEGSRGRIEGAEESVKDGDLGEGEERGEPPADGKPADAEVKAVVDETPDEEEDEDYSDGEDDDGSVPDEGPVVTVEKDNLVESPDTGAKLLEEVCRETTDNLLLNDKAFSDSDSGSDFDDGPSSPTPSEQLRPDFLRLAPSPTPSEQAPPDLPRGVTMVAIGADSNAAADRPSTSPAFPSASPDAPTDGEDDATATDDAAKLDDSSIFPATGFQWGSSEVNEPMATSPSQESDPLQLPDVAGESPMQLLTSDALLRGFLTEDKSVPSSVAVTLSNDGQLSLGSEYISLDHLGEFRCEVCGERATSRETLDEHRIKVGHYKCNRPECCGKVFSNAEELSTHLRSTHASTHTPTFARPSLIVVNQSLQSPPVQQLQQQVQRMVMPSQPGYLSQTLSNSLPLSQMPNQPPHPSQPSQPPGFAHDPQRGRPPMYRVPAPVSMAPPPQHMGAGGLTPQFTSTQQMMSQMYGPQYRPMPPGFPMTQQQLQQQQQQQQQQQHQQRPPYMQQMQMQRPQQMQQQQQQQQQQRMMHPNQNQQMRGQMQGPQIRAKRMAGMVAPQGAPPAKRRADNDIHMLQQKRLQPNSVSEAAKRSGLPDSMIHLTESITLSVRQPPAAVTVTPIGTPPKNKSDAKAVANVLAQRGITVTPAANSNNNMNNARPPQQQQQRQAPSVSSPVATLNLNSAISIIPTGGGGQASSGFAVPQNRSRQPQPQNVERPPRPPTVDLTGDGPMGQHHNAMQARGRRGRPPGSASNGGRHRCVICEKLFATEEGLAQHMTLHRSPAKLPYRCNLCTAQYPTQQGLLQHRQVYHKEPAAGPELAIPVVDLKQPGVLARLSNIGIVNYIPLSQLSSPQGGHFGLPIISVDGARDPAVSNLSAMGASNILSLGPIKQLPRV